MEKSDETWNEKSNGLSCPASAASNADSKFLSNVCLLNCHSVQFGLECLCFFIFAEGRVQAKLAKRLYTKPTRITLHFGFRNTFLWASL